MGIRLRNKGEMFLITATIVVVILILLKASVNLPDIVERERQLEGRFEQEFFINTVNELIKTIEISYHQPENITKNVFSSGNFMRDKMIGRLIDFNFLYVGSITPKENGNVRMNVTVINLLNKPINATLQLNDDPISFSEVADSESWDTSFTIVQGMINILTIGYNGTYEENITIQTEMNESGYIGFFDITLIGLETTYKDKFQKSYTLP